MTASISKILHCSVPLNCIQSSVRSAKLQADTAGDEASAAKKRFEEPAAGVGSSRRVLHRVPPPLLPSLPPPSRDWPLCALLKQFHPSRTGLLAWALFRRSGSSSSSGGDDGMAGVGGGSGRPCPLTFHRPSLEELRQGATPYLLGGRQQPACTNCRRSGEWAEICQFKAGPLCSEVGGRGRVPLPTTRGPSLGGSLPSWFPIACNVVGIWPMLAEGEGSVLLCCRASRRPSSGAGCSGGTSWRCG